MEKDKGLLSRARVAWAPLLLGLALCGCMHIEERIVLITDGSALVNTRLKVHAGTLQLVDAMFGGMIQAFESMGAKPGQSASPPPPPVSVAEKMFANKDDILAKLKKSGLQASLESFKSQKNDDGLVVDYTVRVSDVVALTRSGILMTKVRIMRNAQGDWFCRPVADHKKKKEGQSQKMQFEKFRDSPQYKAMPEDMQKKMQDSIMDFKAEFSLEFPVPVTEVTGLFEKKDARTVGFGFNMAMLQYPQLYAKLVSAATSQLARTGSGAVPPDFFALAPGEEDVPDGADVSEGTGAVDSGESFAARTAAVKVQGKVKIHLKSGTSVDGRVLEKTDNFLKIDFDGVELTYYNDEVDRIE